MTEIIIIFLIVLTYLFSSIIIDVLTLIFVGFYRIFKILFKIPQRKFLPLPEGTQISIIIPAFNEEKYIMRAIDSAFNQTLKPKQVIVVDDASTDKTLKICMKAKKKYKNLRVIQKKKNKGKAHSIKLALNNCKLSDITLVLDADTFLAKDYLEKIIKPFGNKRVVIVTGVSLPLKEKNFFSKIVHYGSIFQYSFSCFRKSAQALRNSVAVVTGDSAAYRTSFLKEVGGFPQGTVTEDIDIAWIALEKGYRVSFQEDAQAKCNDASTLKGHLKQVMRWYSGSLQCALKHGRNLFKAKPLLFTTIIPIFFDSTLYTFSFLFAIASLFFYLPFFIGFFIADFIFTSLAIIYLNWRWFRRLPEIYVIKFVWTLVWVAALLKTTLEYMSGKRYWDGTWTNDDLIVKGNNSQKQSTRHHQLSTQQK